VQLKPIILKTENGIHLVSKALHSISAFVLFLLMILMTIDVISRYVFKHAITGSVDLVVLMMVIFIFLSFPNTTYRRNHARTDVLYERLSPRKQAVFDIITIGLSALIMLFISWQLGARALNIIQNPPGLSTSYFYWPHFPFIMLAAFCCGLMCLELIIWVIQSIHTAIKCKSAHEN
jgi:TRAP-type C4-dicarboxylate transport system permease small subunit